MVLADEEDALVAYALGEYGIVAERIDWERGPRDGADACACLERSLRRRHRQLAGRLKGVLAA